MIRSNFVKLHGNIGKDPELKFSKSGKSILKFSMATSESVGNDEYETAWHNIVMFGKTADMAAKVLNKGTKILIEGKISYSKYENKEGIIVHTTSILANEFLLLAGNPNKENG